MLYHIGNQLQINFGAFHYIYFQFINFYVVDFFPLATECYCLQFGEVSPSVCIQLCEAKMGKK
ncbi:hypothetical protein NC652_026743 [Populus alba x Populus x berolinensis]|nr:hypothetical protein NC652_026743 [Populus alba x Populus x berolinensis]